MDNYSAEVNDLTHKNTALQAQIENLESEKMHYSDAELELTAQVQKPAVQGRRPAEEDQQPGSRAVGSGREVQTPFWRSNACLETETSQLKPEIEERTKTIEALQKNIKDTEDAQRKQEDVVKDGEEKLMAALADRESRKVIMMMIS